MIRHFFKLEHVRRHRKTTNARQLLGHRLIEETTSKSDFLDHLVRRFRSWHEISANLLGQAANERNNAILHQTRHQPTRLRVIQLPQPLDRDRDCGAVVVGSGRELIVDWNLHGSHQHLVGIQMRGIFEIRTRQNIGARHPQQLIQLRRVLDRAIERTLIKNIFRQLGFVKQDDIVRIDHQITGACFGRFSRQFLNQPLVVDPKVLAAGELICRQPVANKNLARNGRINFPIVNRASRHHRQPK